MFGKTEKYSEPEVSYTIIEDVQSEVISLDDAKAFMQIDFPDFDGIIPLFITAAREEAEKYTGLSIGTRTLQLSGEWEKADAYMPFEPIMITSPEGVQVVGYTSVNLPRDLKLAMLTMIHTAFENRINPDYRPNLRLLDRSRRRVGL